MFSNSGDDSAADTNEIRCDDGPEDSAANTNEIRCDNSLDDSTADTNGLLSKCMIDLHFFEMVQANTKRLELGDVETGPMPFLEDLQTLDVIMLGLCNRPTPRPRLTTVYRRHSIFPPQQTQ